MTAKRAGGRKKEGRAAAQRRAGQSAEKILVETTQLKCPSGHRLPNRTNHGRCTPVYCAGANGKPNSEGKAPGGAMVALGKMGAEVKKQRSEALKIVSEAADRTIDAMIPDSVPGYEQARAAAKAQKSEELLKLAAAIGRHAAMRAYFNVPEGLEGAAAEEYVQRKAMMLSVDALAVFERQLKLGDDSQQREAARDILKMTGQHQKEAAPNASAVIILNNPTGIQGLPYLSAVAKRQFEVIEAPKELPEDAKKRS